jgi:hypothetical protein
MALSKQSPRCPKNVVSQDSDQKPACKSVVLLALNGLGIEPQSQPADTQWGSGSYLHNLIACLNRTHSLPNFETHRRRKTTCTYFGDAVETLLTSGTVLLLQHVGG